MSDNIKTLPLSEIPTEKLNHFLLDTFGDVKGNFLVRNGEWWRRGNWESPALLDQNIDKIIGYTHYIGTRLLINRQPIDTRWWGDVLVSSRISWATSFNHG